MGIMWVIYKGIHLHKKNLPFKEASSRAYFICVSLISYLHVSSKLSEDKPIVTMQCNIHLKRYLFSVHEQLLAVY